MPESAGSAGATTDCCIVGGGIVGLSIARELAGRGRSVRVVTREPGRETASWAAAGIFPPAPEHPACTANERLTAWSDVIHRAWSRELLTETGIDNELEACGGLHLAGVEADFVRLETMATSLRNRGGRAVMLSATEVGALEPLLAPAVGRGLVAGGLLLPDEMRIRPPRHLDALEASCRMRGVEFVTAVAVGQFVVRDGRVTGLILEGDRDRSVATVVASQYCLAAGAWSGHLASQLGLSLETRPIRGQIALLRLPKQQLSRVVNFGLDYLVPRTDGRLLAGSTIEDAGFDCSTTKPAIDRLLAFVHRLLGPLPDAILERSWAGLRPGSADGMPFLGCVPGIENAFVAAGHFRAGLHQSTGTAVILADLMTGRRPPLDPRPFAAGRRPVVGGPDSVTAYLDRVASESAAAEPGAGDAGPARDGQAAWGESLR